MHWALIFLIQGSIQSVTFDDYQSCVNAGNNLVIAGTHFKYVCVEK